MIGFAAAVTVALLAQEPAVQDDQAQDALRLFLDCPSWICDLDFLRTEITFVNYVRDQQSADVTVLVTTLSTGSGGTQYTLSFIGRGRFAGRADTLTHSAGVTDTPDDRRRGIARVLRLGLVRYVAATPQAAYLDVRYAAPDAGGAAAPQQPRDPWNFWVFRIGVNGFTYGEKQSAYRSFSTSASANRITERWKIELSARGNTNRQRFELDSVTTFITRRESYSGSALVVRSLGPHWSVGGDASISSNTFNNLDLRLRLSPALEFNVFPYAQSTRRQLTLRYAIGIEASDYSDTTLFGQVQETRPVHSLEAAYAVRQPWGNVNVFASHRQYLHDTSKRNEEVGGSMSIRLLRGLSFNLGGSYTVVRDQLSLQAAGATPAEIIARQRQLATSYFYNFSFGVNYRFGSIFNNVVNPRFGGGGGEGMIFFN